MDITNITFWSETAAFPILSVLTLIPLATMVSVTLTSSPVIALRLGFVGTILTCLLSVYLLAVFNADQPGIQLYERYQILGMTYSTGVDGTNILFGAVVD